MRPSLIIFDCDGVLVDTETISNRVLSDMIGFHGVAITPAECRHRFVGRTIESIQAEVEAECNRPMGFQWPELLRSATEAAFEAGVEAIPGVRSALDTIVRSGTRYCVASSGRLTKMRKSLGKAGLLTLFEELLFSAEQVKVGKPAPDLFLFAAAQMQVPPERCVVIEDSVTGVRAGLAASMRVLAFAGDPLADQVGLKGSGVELFYDMAELPNLLGIPT